MYPFTSKHLPPGFFFERPPPPPNNHRTAVYPEETVLGTENPPGTDLAKGQHIPCFGAACSPLLDLTGPAQPYGRGGGDLPRLEMF